MKIVSSIFPNEKIQEDIKKEFPEITFEFYKGMKAAEEAFYDCDAFLTYGDDLTDQHIQKNHQLKWIMLMSAGLEKMPLKAIEEKGIIVTNARGIHTIPMAEFTIGSMLQWVKQTKALLENEQGQVWDRKLQMGELCEKTVLILGVGAIGGEIARLAKAFRMRTIGVNRSGKAVEHIDELFLIDQLMTALPKADFIVSVLPSTAETKQLLTKEHFTTMKDTAVFINIGRGDLVDGQVLQQALESNTIAHAFLDVFEKEPLEKNHPFWHMKNVTVTPHLSSVGKKYLPRSFTIFKHNLSAYLNKSDDYINLIDLHRGY
ncbi:D-2-hydroxyacid dehydrogenase [Bacillus sp. V3B]|uniref:D-2-hydroxyacid dehydrogenase n=1 Tax=Bacillus sp. V3B TaxID=2804915 RepID=UPI00210B96B8|nr:D-2-hydroxyacid dehydrogenase [Bacillus sp. V3B]MCQ6277235.1 D-2-hydroxyacid dehydrogenase [Bacillus sp. V3B]